MAKHPFNFSYDRKLKVYLICVHVLLNLSNELVNNMRGFMSIFHICRREFDKFNNNEHECSILFMAGHLGKLRLAFLA